MDSFLDIFLIDFISIFMGISSISLFAIFLFLSLVFAYKRIKNPKLFKQIDENIEYKISEILNFLLSSITLVSYCVIKYFFFTKMDMVLNSLWILLGIISVNILFKMFCILIKIKEKFNPIRNLFLRIIDNYVMIITITLSCAIIAAQIPIVDISKFFGQNVPRFSLINLPFLLSGLFIVSSCFSILFQYLFVKIDQEVKSNINDIFKVILPLFIMVFITIFYPLSYNLFMVISIGVLSKYIAEKVSTYLNKRKISSRKSSFTALSFLSPTSNIFCSSLMDLSIMVILIFTSLNSAGFFGVTVASLGLISSTILTSNVNIFDKQSEAYKYIAKTLTNVALFYIFFETLEFIYKKQMHINISANNVIIGLFTSIVLMMFNILKIVNLAKYIEMSAKHTYIAVRTLIYIVMFVICFYYLLPFINYELLGALVLGLILMTAFVSILVINGIDVFENQDGKAHLITPLLRNNVLPLTNQITTLIIIVTILLLPIIK